MPQAGDIKPSLELGFSGRRRNCIYRVCVECGQGRWITNGKRSGRFPRCQPCVARITGRENRGENHGWWSGGRFLDRENGYIRVMILPKDEFFLPMANRNRYVAEHRLVMARHLGRNLHSWEIVHHINSDKLDNRLENLQLVSYEKHRQITILIEKIGRLEKINKELQDRVLILEAERLLSEG